MEPLTIGELAKQAGVGVERIRFYEREGLLRSRSGGLQGNRQYAAEVVRRVHSFTM